MENKVKRKLRQNEKVVGCFIGIYSPAIVEMLGYAGFDFIVIDNEHGSFTWRDIEEMIKAAELSNIEPFVRVSYNPSDIQKALDLGAKGIHVPMVNTKEQALQLIKRAKFPLEGERGVAYSVRSAKYGMKSEINLQEINNEILVAIHIETPTAVDNIDEILEVEGIDVFYVGPTDLSANFGYPAEGLKNNNVKLAIELITSKCEEMNRWVGLHVGNEKGLIENKENDILYQGLTLTVIINHTFESIIKNK